MTIFNYGCSCGYQFPSSMSEGPNANYYALLVCREGIMRNLKPSLLYVLALHKQDLTDTNKYVLHNFLVDRDNI